MAKRDHIRILKQGVKPWNEWRVQNPEEKPDLSGADLVKSSFTGADFSNTNFHEARLHMWSVTDCNFEGAILTNINAQDSYWRNTNLRGTEISGDLIHSSIYRADLSDASIHNCGLLFAELRYLQLNSTNFAPYLRETHVNSWTIINSDLSGMQNPHNAVVEYPFNIDFETLRKTAKGLQDHTDRTKEFSTFFKECGLPDDIVAVFESWVKVTPTISEAVSQSTNFYSCFISYSHKDRAFAKFLQKRLQTHGIQCWFDEDYLLPGDDVYDALDHGIRQWDKVLLCCSENSLNSPWVDREMDKALQKEERLWRERGRKILVIIPLDLDGYLFKWESGKASTLQSRLAVDLTSWETDKTKLEEQLNKVIKALRADKGARPPIPESKL